MTCPSEDSVRYFNKERRIDMDHEYDVAVIGTGTSAYMLAYPCRSAGKSVAMIDSRPYGGTCAMRGCQPKKYPGIGPLQMA